MKLSISKDTFCRTIQAVTVFVGFQNYLEYEAAEALELPYESVFSRYRSEIVEPVVDFIEETMHDDEGIVRDFIFDRPAKGEEFDLVVILRCRKEAVIHYKHLGDLYDYLALRAAQNGDSEKDQQERTRLCKVYGVSCC